MRYTIYTDTDEIECDGYLVANQNCIEIGYKDENGNFVHEVLNSTYFRIVDHEPKFTYEEFIEACNLEEAMEEPIEAPLDTAHKPGEKKKPKEGQLLFDNASFYI
jgi:hypothetical protein